ncbi:MAG: magnesium/cobalt transporter CorA [Anaerolineae bacterium]|nr:magnesium/cobalt transporter CorA [Anaerolineae bacterium]
MFPTDHDLYPEISSRAGLPPGELVFVGQIRQPHSTLQLLWYGTEQGIVEQQCTDIDEAITFAAEHKKGITWINLNGLQNTEWVSRLGGLANVHPLILEDILNTNQRPKMDEFNDGLFIELNMLRWNEEAKNITAEQFSMLVKKGVLITFQEVDGDIFDTVRQHIREGGQRFNEMGVDYLLYALIDTVVDHYFIALENLSDAIEELEDQISQHPGPETLTRIHQLKRDLLFLRKSIWPLREVISGLARGTAALIHKETLIYMRDVYDHSVQVMDIVETFRDMVSGMMDIYLSSVSNQMNEVMKVLTVISTLFIPLTFIAGVYGMNFDFMPELTWRWGYFTVLAVMGSILLIMVLFFRRRKWF